MIGNTHIMLKEGREWSPKYCDYGSNVTWEVAINKVQLLMIRASAMTSVITMDNSVPTNRSGQLLL